MRPLPVLLLVAAAACRPATEAPAPPAIPAPVDGERVMPVAGTGVRGKVVQVLDGDGRTFAEVVGPGGTRQWLAVRNLPIDVGDEVEYPATEPTANVESKALGRTFERVLVVPSIRVMK